MSGGDPYRKVTPGEPVKIPARAWNELMRGLRPMPDAGGEPIDGFSAPYQWVYGKNVTPYAIPRWRPVGIREPVAIPTGPTGQQATAFQAMPVMAITSGSGSDTSFTNLTGVTIEPIAAGKVGRVALSGVVQVEASQLPVLRCYQLFWKNDTWALVSLGAPTVLRGTFAAPWPKGSTRTVTLPNNVMQYQAVNYFATLSATGTKTCAIAFANGEWILIAAEC